VHLPIDWRGREIHIEYQWVGETDADTPVMVFLHEGLGSVALWKTFPDLLCRRLKMRGLVYSRPGYGQSTPRAKDERWDADFMHRQAFDVLPALLSQLNIDQPWLFGHSDGGSISLLFASQYSERCAGLIVVAPHIMVEDISITSILLARDAYLHQGLRERLARYHDDVDSAFFGWNDVWLSPAFRHWSIQADLKNIRCPLLAVQGEDDEYGTMEQVYGIQRILPHAVVIPVADCGHSPHRDQPQLLTEAVVQFVSALRTTC
jgi:pimeloyl-ACP methyl ester carboxylesterase